MSYGLRIRREGVVAGDVLPQFISPANAQAYLDRVQRDAVRLDFAIDQAQIGKRDPQWVAQWKGWLIAWRTYYMTTSGNTTWSAPTIYTTAEAKHAELRSWYEQAKERGATVGAVPAQQADAPGAGDGLPWYAWAAIAVGAAMVLLGPGAVLAPIGLAASRMRR